MINKLSTIILVIASLSQCGTSSHVPSKQIILGKKSGGTNAQVSQVANQAYCQNQQAQWTVRYYNLTHDDALAEEVIDERPISSNRCEANQGPLSLNYDWGDGGPTGIERTDLFGAKFRTLLMPGTYSLYIRGDDGIRAKVTSRAEYLIDVWGRRDLNQDDKIFAIKREQGPQWLEVEYFEGDGTANIFINLILLGEPSQPVVINPVIPVYPIVGNYWDQNLINFAQTKCFESIQGHEYGFALARKISQQPYLMTPVSKEFTWAHGVAQVGMNNYNQYFVFFMPRPINNEPWDAMPVSVMSLAGYCWNNGGWDQTPSYPEDHHVDNDQGIHVVVRIDAVTTG